MKGHLRLNRPWIPVLLFILITLQAMDASRIWTILIVGLGGAWLIAIFWILSVGGNLHLRRETRLGWVPLGAQIEMRFTISNISFLSALWVIFRDQSSLPGYKASTSFLLGSGEFKQWNIPIPCNRRGLYTFGEAELEISDPFGIYRLSLRDPVRSSLLVLPQIVTLPQFRIRPAGFSGDGRPRPNMPEQIVSVSTVRDYQPRDSMRFIHWPTTARQGKLFVRLMEGAPEGNWWILVDLDQRCMAGEGWDSIEEQSVTLAASLADSGLNAQKSVGLIANGVELAWLPPRRGEGQRWEILLALAEARPGNLELGRLLERSQAPLGRHHSLLVITASTKSDWPENLLSFTRRGISPTVFLLDPASLANGKSIQPAAALMQSYGIECHLIQRELLPEGARTFQTGRWSWHRTPTGQVLPLQIPESAMMNRTGR
jgi:uncharacterized protein (DUF58 family)